MSRTSAQTFGNAVNLRHDSTRNGGVPRTTVPATGTAPSGRTGSISLSVPLDMTSGLTDWYVLRRNPLNGHTDYPHPQLAHMATFTHPPDHGTFDLSDNPLVDCGNGAGPSTANYKTRARPSTMPNIVVNVPEDKSATLLSYLMKQNQAPTSSDKDYSYSQPGPSAFRNPYDMPHHYSSPQHYPYTPGPPYRYPPPPGPPPFHQDTRAPYPSMRAQPPVQAPIPTAGPLPPRPSTSPQQDPTPRRVIDELPLRLSYSPLPSDYNMLHTCMEEFSEREDVPYWDAYERLTAMHATPRSVALIDVEEAMEYTNFDRETSLKLIEFCGQYEEMNEWKRTLAVNRGR